MRTQSITMNFLTPFGAFDGSDSSFLDSLLVTLGVLLIMGLVLGAWFLGQSILSRLLIRESTAFCPCCYSRDFRPSRYRRWESFFPFLPIFCCYDCGERFVWGRKPPFACCPSCSSALLQTVPSRAVPDASRRTLRNSNRTQTYFCAECQLEFRDARPNRAEALDAKETLNKRIA